MNTLEIRVIKNKNSIAQLVGGNVFYIQYLPNTFSKLEDIKESFEAYQVLGNGLPLQVLIEFSSYASASKEAREYAQQNELPALSEALVINSLPQRILLSFYLKFRKQKHPIKVFKCKNNALNWLNSISHPLGN